MDIALSLINGAVEDIFFFGVMFVVTMAIIITIHEFGHYMAARLCGVRVEQFAFGFGREIIGFHDKHKTRWSICLFPIGGFVKLFGDVDPNNPIIWDHENDTERRLTEGELAVAFCSKNVWQRVSIVFAGPAINIVLTFSILLCAFITYGQRSKPVTITAIAHETAAHEAGVMIGDQILMIDGRSIRRLEDIYDITKYENPPQKHTYTILRNGTKTDITFTARYQIYHDRKGVAQQHGQTGMVRLGAVKFEKILSVNGHQTRDNEFLARQLIMENFDRDILIETQIREDIDKKPNAIFQVNFSSKFNTHLNDPEHEHFDRVFSSDPDQQLFIRLSAPEAIQESSILMYRMVYNSYKFIRAIPKGKMEEPVIGGIAKISEKTAKASKAGFYDYVMFVAAMSYMIAIINLLPIPGLDGGYLMFYIYEIVTGKAISPRIQSLSLIIGLVILMGIMIFANITDFLSLFLTN